MKYKNYLNAFSFIFMLVLLFSGCKKDEEEVDTTPPGQVSDLVAIAASEEVVLSWTEPTDSDLDKIEISYTGSDVTLSQAAGLNGITVTGLTNGTVYTFNVVTVDLEGNKSQAVTVAALPNTPFVVTDPNQNNYSHAGVGFLSSDGSGHLIITVTFNRALDVSSVKPAQTIYFEGDAISEGSVSFSNENKTVTFTTTDPLSEFGTYSGDVYFDFILIGDDAGNGVITDSNGMVLDGDKDGESGGDYVLNLYVIG